MSPIVNHILSVILLTPLAGAGVLLLVSSRRPAAIKWLANAFAGAAFLFAVPLWFLYEPLGKTWQFAERGHWLPTIGASYYVGVDGFSLLLVLLTTIVCALALLASWKEIAGHARTFYVAMLVLEAGLLGAFMALDFLLFFVCVLTVLASAYSILDTWGSGRHDVRRFLLTLNGCVSILAGILLLYFWNRSAARVYSFDITQYQIVSVAFDVQEKAFAAFLAGFAVMVSIVPLHVWLPNASEDAPTAGSVVLSALLIGLGPYGYIRFCVPILPDAAVDSAPVVAVLAIAAMLGSSVLALAQRDWKRLVAYSSISQISLATLGMLALTPAGITGAMVQQIAHGISIGALLLIAGVANARRQTYEIAESSGLRKRMPRLAAVFLIAIISAIALAARNVLPPVYAHNRWWGGAAAVSLVLTAACWLRLYARTMLGGGGDSRNTSVRDLTAFEMATLAPLVVLSIGMGLNPAPVVQRLGTSVGRVAIRIDPAYGATVVLGSDCATPAKPDPAGPPPAFVLTEPCADGSDATRPERPPDGIRR